MLLTLFDPIMYQLGVDTETHQGGLHEQMEGASKRLWTLNFELERGCQWSK